jgi:hypothetical protein
LLFEHLAHGNHGLVDLDLASLGEREIRTMSGSRGADLRVTSTSDLPITSPGRPNIPSAERLSNRTSFRFEKKRASGSALTSR